MKTAQRKTGWFSLRMRVIREDTPLLPFLCLCCGCSHSSNSPELVLQGHSTAIQTVAMQYKVSSKGTTLCLPVTKTVIERWRKLRIRNQFPNSFTSRAMLQATNIRSVTSSHKTIFRLTRKDEGRHNSPLLFKIVSASWKEPTIVTLLIATILSITDIVNKIEY